MENYARIPREKLYSICTEALQKKGCDIDRASIVAEVCVEADMRGIFSHGVARLKRYLDHIDQGLIIPGATVTTDFETRVSGVYNGNHGIGQYVSKIVCENAVLKAKKNGIGITVVKNSNHYGIAGYWAEQIMKNEMIGLSSTNTAPIVVPTYGKQAMLGTNPIAVSIPSITRYPFMVDMATSVIPRGKLEVYSRNKKQIPIGWAVDEKGSPATNPGNVLANIKSRKHGGILTLGGDTQEFGGHKGYGLALLVELLTAGLSMGAPSFETYQKHGKICHLFIAMRLDLFGSSSSIMEHITHILHNIKESEPAEDKEEVFLHNEKEYSRREESLKRGVQVDLPTIEALKCICRDYSIPITI